MQQTLPNLNNPNPDFCCCPEEDYVEMLSDLYFEYAVTMFTSP